MVKIGQNANMANSKNESISEVEYNTYAYEIRIKMENILLGGLVR